MAKQIRQKCLRLRSLLLIGLLGLMGLAFSGCPPVAVMYGPPAPEYGVPAPKEAAPANDQQPETERQAEAR